MIDLGLPHDALARALALPLEQQARAIELLRIAQAGAPERVTLRQHLKQVDPGPYLDWWHVGLLIEQVQRVLDGEVRRLLICAPPRMYKSRPVVQGGGSCRIRTAPRSKVFTACSDRDLVLFHSRHTRDHVIASGGRLRSDSKSVSLWETEQGGAYKAVTVNAGKLGFGWDFGIVDDPFASRADALNIRVQNEVWEWYRDHFMSRAQPRPDGGPPGQIVIQQRLASGDLAGKLLDHLEKTLDEQWEALILQGYKKPLSYSLPACVRRIEDPRQDGEPLCDDAETMVQVDERRKTNPWLARAVDDQDPAEEASGGIFCGSWFRRLDTDEQQLLEVAERLQDTAERPARRGVEGQLEAANFTQLLAAIRQHVPMKIDTAIRRGRAWDLNAGGADALASAKGCSLPLDGFRWEDCYEDHPPSALIPSIILDHAAADGVEVEIILPLEPAIGKNYAEGLKADLVQAGYTCHLAPQQGPKRQRALPHAGAAAAHCRRCRQLVVPEDAAELFASLGVCRCPQPEGDGHGLVELAMTAAKADLFVARHHAFTGLPGGRDDLVDAASICYNVLAGGASQAVRTGQLGPFA